MPTLRTALSVLAANNAAAGPSFVHALHERGTFDAAAFWVLFDAMSGRRGARQAQHQSPSRACRARRLL
jgi:hypothetical protein